jgi:L-aspartate oxidase
MPSCDVLIIGSGVAGLSLAIKLNRQFPNKKIYIITKGCELNSNTRHAQGGISIVCNQENDSFESHISDTLTAGDGLCDIDVVTKVVKEGPQVLSELIRDGVDFDRDTAGNWHLGKEGGHSSSRVVHYKDMTGLQIAVSLLVKVKTSKGVTLLQHHTAIDLITDKQTGQVNENVCKGALVLNNKSETIENYISPVTILATGGVGQVYKTTTNPAIATGDGIAMAYRAGAKVRNMEFIQFHPTAFFANERGAQRALISEALRGYGAHLTNIRGERFMFRYHSKGELACRDIAARAIENEIASSGHPCVYLDCRHLSSEHLKKAFPKIYALCQEKGINIAHDKIPVIPAAHYLCGGIAVDHSAMTSVKNLYALGECSDTGLHGANRLASNSLLEAVAFSEFCFQDIKFRIHTIAIPTTDSTIDFPYTIAESSAGIQLLREKLQHLMSKHAGICRTTKGLSYASKYLELLHLKMKEAYPDTMSSEISELRNLITCAQLIITHSLARKVNKGVFYNEDLNIGYAKIITQRELHL